MSAAMCGVPSVPLTSSFPRWSHVREGGRRADDESAEQDLSIHRQANPEQCQAWRGDDPPWVLLMASTACRWVFMRVAEFFQATLQDDPTLWSRPARASSTRQMLPSPLDFTEWDDTADDRGWFASHICPSCWAGVGATFLVGGQV